MSNIIPFGELQGMAHAVAASNLFGMKTADQALALMLVAQAEGQHPATITQDYDIIQGKATRKTHSVLARFQQMGGTVEWHELTDQIADATFSHKSGGRLRMAWTFEQAKKAGLTNKDNWKNYPRAMLRARCIAEGIRAIFPAALGGMLVSEEAQDIQAGELPHGEPSRLPALPRPERQPYSDEDIAKNSKMWRAVIESGKTDSASLIAKIEAKFVLTEAQRKAIAALAPLATEEHEEGVE